MLHRTFSKERFFIFNATNKQEQAIQYGSWGSSHHAQHVLRMNNSLIFLCNGIISRAIHKQIGFKKNHI